MEVKIINKITNKLYEIEKINDIQFIYFALDIDTEIGKIIDVEYCQHNETTLRITKYNNHIFLKIPNKIEKSFIDNVHISDAELGYYICDTATCNYLHKDNSIRAGICRDNNYEIGYWDSLVEAKQFYISWRMQFN